MLHCDYNSTKNKKILQQMGATASIQSATFEDAKAESERLGIRLPRPLKKMEAHDKRWSLGVKTYESADHGWDEGEYDNFIVTNRFSLR